MVVPLPALLILVPLTGALVAMTMVTRRAAWVTSIVTFFAQVALLVLAGVQLHRFADARPAGALPNCADDAATEGTKIVLAQCFEWFPQWGIQFDIAVSWATLGLLALTALVTVSAAAFSWWADRPRPAPLHGLLWFTAAALSGLFVSRDLVLFYVFFELMLVPLLILVGVWGGEQRVRATMTMFIYTLVGSLPMLVGVIAVGIAANDVLPADGSTTFSLPTLAGLAAEGKLELSSWVLVSFLLAFAIKAPLIPFHGWLPLAYRQAPAEVTAVLSGLVSKAAFFGFFVVVLPLFPGALDGGWGVALTWIALASLLYGSVTAFRQPDPRGVIAYSSLAQMGLIVLGLATFLGDGAQQGLAGAYLQTINHGLISAGLFLLVGIVEIRSGESTFAQLGGLATGRARLLTIALTLTLITLAVPGATTFAGELLILTGAFRGDGLGPLVGILGSLAVVLAAMYALRLIAGVFFTDEPETPAESAAANERFGGDLVGKELLIVLPALLALVALSVWPNLVRRPMNQPPVPIAAAADPLEKLKAEHEAAAHDTAEGDHEAEEEAH